MTTVQSATATAPAAGAGTLSSATASEQQDRFMKLLVAQMKNQDPLNPMDNAEMTSQIAQINTVSGIEKLNRTVESLLSGFTALQAQSATQLPGRTVLIEGNTLALGEAGAVAGIELAAAAESVQVEILDAAGQTVQVLPLGASPAGVRSFGWDGKLANGQAAPAGDYRMRVTAVAAGKPVQATPLTGVVVQAVANGKAGLQIDLGAHGLHALGDIKSFL